LRKYFEIPALGSVLVCLPCNGFEELGFRDKVNAMICEPDQLPELARWLNENTDKAQEIADAGRRLITERHTIEARACQLKTALESVLAGKWRGGVWRDGVIAPIS
jgi:spore maturation protein CgeB